ncbi:MAG: hypothetical protein K2Y32_11835 [Candidatus Obscuribacterales bacterium]|nr:hypothetical protein [Candidatus Obscuribacterales bacterium]
MLERPTENAAVAEKGDASSRLSLDSNQVPPRADQLHWAKPDYSLSEGLKGFPDLKLKTEESNSDSTLKQPQSAALDQSKSLFELSIPPNFRLPSNTNEIKPLDLNLRLTERNSRDFILNPKERAQFEVQYKSLNKDWRETLDNAVTFKFRVFDDPYELSLNTRKCGMRSRPGLCLKRSIH